MQKFNYTITKEREGIHARPAGLIAKLAKLYTGCIITISKNDQKADASHLVELMALCVKNGETVTITAEGVNEEAAIQELKAYFEGYL